MKAWCVWLAFAVLCIVPTLAPAADFKIPPTPDHYVTDDAAALSSETRAKLENELQAYETATGHQIVVWIGQTTGDVPLETWTTETADHWKIGRRGHDDGAVLFVFMSDHKVRIEVGYGLESSLTDADAHRIIESQVIPRMRRGDVDEAVSSGVAAMLTTITPAYASVTPPPQASRGAPAWNDYFAIWLFLAVVILTIGLRIARAIYFGHLVLSEGYAKASKDLRRSRFWGGAFVGGSGGGGFGGGGGGFSAGGGGFGGGGASGGW